MSATAPLTPPPVPPDSAATKPPRGRRAIVVVAIVLVLVVVAWFAGEAIARAIVQNTIRDRIATQLAAPEDDIDVQVDGVVLLQLIGGTLDQVHVGVDDAPLGDDLEGDVAVTAEGVPVRGDDPVEQIHGNIVFDSDQARAIIEGLDSVPVEIDSVDLVDDGIEVGTSLDVAGFSISIATTMAVSMDADDLVLTPKTFSLAGADVSLDDLREQFGAVLDPVLQDWRVCLASSIPRGVTIDDVQVEDDRFIVTGDVDGAIVNDPSLREEGTCS